MTHLKGFHRLTLMRFSRLSLAAGYFFLAAARPTTASEVAPVTLQECLEQAQRTNERLQLQSENVKQIQARKNQARGSVLPDIRWKQATTWQDTSGVSSSGGSGTDSNAVLKRRRTASFNAVQPIFSGFKEFSAIRGFDAERRSAESILIREKILLSQDVARAFYSALSLHNDLLNFQTEVKLNEDRIRELKDRARLGRAREGEVVSAESQLANVKAAEAHSRGLLAVAREQLSYLIGTDIAGRPLNDTSTTPILPERSDIFNQIESRSDISAMKDIVEARRFGVRAARADHWPIVEAEGNYYTHRIGFQKDIDWDIILSVDVPIFQGGTVSAQADEALSLWRTARLEYDQHLRRVKKEVNEAHASFNSSLEETLLLEDAYKKAKRNYDLLARDYRHGLVTNLDVLQGLTLMQQIKKDWDRAFVQSKMWAIDFAVATESPMPLSQLNPGNDR